MSSNETAIEVALARATAPVADGGDGWETTAAVLAHEVESLRHWKAEAQSLIGRLERRHAQTQRRLARPDERELQEVDALAVYLAVNKHEGGKA